ncbi:hypothetical protein [Methanolobus psychrotolerans]|uniref:hypothetical protein n=1 Tax=Methanolobus psychrotolerans TaxID=1874706 RepID=UPI00101AD785|nr:hypothetical protein [Methanolobus psychrotolerans]
MGFAFAGRMDGILCIRAGTINARTSLSRTASLRYIRKISLKCWKVSGSENFVLFMGVECAACFLNGYFCTKNYEYACVIC